MIVFLHGCIIGGMKTRRPRIDGDTVIIPLTRGYEARVDSEDADLGGVLWHALVTGRLTYAKRCIWRERKDVYLHRVIAERMGIDVSTTEVDHADGDPLNCRRSNLRPATHAQNAMNGPLRRNNKSGYKGVCWFKPTRKWMAQIMVNRKTTYLGYFDTKEEAAAAYAAAATRLHGPFARV